MFSFFRSSKKTSPTGSADTVATPTNDADFVVVPQPNQQPPAPYGNMYPSFTPGGTVQFGSIGGGGGAAAAPTTSPSDGGGIGSGTGHGAAVNRQLSDGSFSYLQGVPFKLSADIQVPGVGSQADRSDIWRIEVDQILANMTRAVDLYGQ